MQHSVQTESADVGVQASTSAIVILGLLQRVDQKEADGAFAIQLGQVIRTVQFLLMRRVFDGLVTEAALESSWASFHFCLLTLP